MRAHRQLWEAQQPCWRQKSGLLLGLTWEGCHGHHPPGLSSLGLVCLIPEVWCPLILTTLAPVPTIVWREQCFVLLLGLGWECRRWSQETSTAAKKSLSQPYTRRSNRHSHKVESRHLQPLLYSYLMVLNQPRACSPPI